MSILFIKGRPLACCWNCIARPPAGGCPSVGLSGSRGPRHPPRQRPERSRRPTAPGTRASHAYIGGRLAGWLPAADLPCRQCRQYSGDRHRNQMGIHISRCTWSAGSTYGRRYHEYNRRIRRSQAKVYSHEKDARGQESASEFGQPRQPRVW